MINSIQSKIGPLFKKNRNAIAVPMLPEYLPPESLPPKAQPPKFPESSPPKSPESSPPKSPEGGLRIA